MRFLVMTVLAATVFSLTGCGFIAHEVIHHHDHHDHGHKHHHKKRHHHRDHCEPHRHR